MLFEALDIEFEMARKICIENIWSEGNTESMYI